MNAVHEPAIDFILSVPLDLLEVLLLTGSAGIVAD